MNSDKFKKLPKNKQARLIAHDVISQRLLDSRHVAEHGKYICVVGTESNECLDANYFEEESCQMCAKGYAFYSKIKLLEDSNSFNSFSPEFDPYLLDVFGETYHVIELVFEDGNIWRGSEGVSFVAMQKHGITKKMINNFNYFCENIPGDYQKNRIEQIMRNFLFNDKIDLTNHPNLEEEIHVDDLSGSVIMCETKKSIDFTNE